MGVQRAFWLRCWVGVQRRHRSSIPLSPHLALCIFPLACSELFPHVLACCHFSGVQLFATHTVAHQVPLTMGFSKYEYWSGLPCPTPGTFLTQGSNWHLLGLPHWQVSSFPLVPPATPCILHNNPAILLSKNVFLSLPAVLASYQTWKGDHGNSWLAVCWPEVPEAWDLWLVSKVGTSLVGLNP